MSVKNFMSACIVVKPKTIFDWHRKLVSWKWNYIHLRAGRPRTEEDIVALVKKFKNENRLWGAGRIHGELVKLKINVSETTVRNILRELGFKSPDKSTGPSWRDFLRQYKTVWAMDLFAVETAFLKTFYIFVLMDARSRILLDLKVGADSTDFWISNILKWRLGEYEVPSIILRDGDTRYGEKTRDVVNSVSKLVRIPPGCPDCNAHVERLIGSIRRECTDHFLFFNRRQIQKVLDEYRIYYNESRPHRSLGQETPVIMPMRLERTQNLDSKSHVTSLHREYFWAS
jgi:putative transposase